MTKEEIKQIVWQEIGRTLDTLLTGIASGADGLKTEGIANMLPGTPTNESRPVAFPYGFNSRTPDGVPQLVGRLGNSPINRGILGHFDPDRPSVGVGETVIYNQFGQQIRLENGKIRIGTAGSSHPFVLGDILKTLLSQMLTSISVHTHGAPGSPPTNAAEFVTQKADFVTNDAILSQEVEGM